MQERFLGIVLCVAIALVAALIAGIPNVFAGIPGLRVLGILGWALVLGILVRSSLTLPPSTKAGVSYSAKTILRLGIVLLGVRLNLSSIVSSGILVLCLDVLIVLVGILGVNALGKHFGFSRGLRLSLAFGTGICGASAAVAAGSVASATDEEVSLAVGTVSLVGTFGVLGFILLREPLGLSDSRYGILTGSTLQEVGQVIAAAGVNPSALDTATLAKLARVALLAPALVIVSGVLRMRGVGGDDKEHPPVLPPFLLGFLLLGVMSSFELLPQVVSSLAQTLSFACTAAAMAGIGLGVDFKAVRRVGVKVMLVGSVGFLALLLLAVLVTEYFAR
ncbi:MAG: YeiH family protein [Deinococcales bacterium]